MEPLDTQRFINKKYINHIISLLITIYHAVNQELEKMNKHYLTPRNLGMMTLRFYFLYQDSYQSALIQPETEDRMDVDNEKNLNQLPEDITKLLTIAMYDEIVDDLDFDKAIAILQTKISSINIKSVIKLAHQTDNLALTFSTTNDLILTSNRKQMLYGLELHLHLRALRIANAKIASFAGLGIKGLLFEGPSGIGKTHFVIHYLKSQGFIDGNSLDIVLNTQIGHSKLFYHLTPADLSLLKNTLEKAYQQGAVVVIDEINTLPLEHILNDLLSGENPNSSFQATAGFCVIATQNPITFSGRKLLSDAFLRRFNVKVLEDFNEADLIQLAKTVGKMPEEKAIELAEFYLQAQKAAKAQGVINPPNSRTFLQFLQKNSLNTAPANNTLNINKHSRNLKREAEETTDITNTAKRIKFESPTTSVPEDVDTASTEIHQSMRLGM